MSIICRCPACDAKFKVDDKYAGRKAKCPRCATVTEVPPLDAGSSAMGSADRVAPETPAPPPPAPAADPLAALAGVSSNRRSHVHRAKNKKPPQKAPSASVWRLVAGVVCVSLVALGGGVLGVKWLLNRSGKPLASPPAQLVLEWPPEERGAAMVHIDGQKQTIPPTGDVAYRLAVGDHRLVIRRRGYEPIEVALSLKQGDVRRFAPQWKSLFGPPESGSSLADETVPAGFEGWTQRFDTALRRAKRNTRDVLVALVGSDWNEATVRLARQVFPNAEFHRRAKEGLELVVIDLPRSQEAYERILDSAQNAMLRKEYRVSADDVPALVLLDSLGDPYAIERSYSAESAQQLLSDLDRWRAEREERDRLFSQIEGRSGDEQLAAAVAAVDWLRQRDLTHFYGDRIRAWERIARARDPANAAGQYESLFEANWLVRFIAALRNEDQEVLERIAADFDRWREKFAFHDADRAARMHLAAAAAKLQLGRQEEAAEHINYALEQKPQDPDLRAQLQALAQIFSGELASGTGFVVAPGYVLTNRHVIEGPGRAMVAMGSDSEQETPAEVIAEDRERDLALLRVTGPIADLPPLAIYSAQVNRGSAVAAFGYPLGNALGAGLKFTQGVVSGLPDAGNNNLYLLDVLVNPGNSGGPLCDQYGRVIGMVTAKSSNTRMEDSYGMALPGAALREFLERALPDWNAPNEATPADRLPWDEVDQAISPSVLMVVKRR